MKAIHCITAALLAASFPASAQAQKALATGDVNHDGVTAEVTECKRSEGTLTVKVRLRNSTDQDISLYLVSGNKYDNHYVTAGKKKYLMLRDAEKKPLAPAANPGGDVYVNLRKGSSYLWWAKFPAPPAEVKKIEYTWPMGPPIDGIACTDA